MQHSIVSNAKVNDGGWQHLYAVRLSAVRIQVIARIVIYFYKYRLLRAKNARMLSNMESRKEL